jgi:cbb3-type cytochrome oxidase subunit 3
MERASDSVGGLLAAIATGGLIVLGIAFMGAMVLLYRWSRKGRKDHDDRE